MPLFGKFGHGASEYQKQKIMQRTMAQKKAEDSMENVTSAGNTPIVKRITGKNMVNQVREQVKRTTMHFKQWRTH